MSLDAQFIAFVASLDDALDLTYPHAAVTFCCAIASMWLMQCLTRNAGISLRQRGMLAFRICLAGMSIGLALNCAFTIQIDANPWVLDTAVRFLLLSVLLTLPYAVRGYSNSSPLERDH